MPTRRCRCCSQPAADPELRGYQQYYRALALTRAGSDRRGASGVGGADGRAPLTGALGDAVRLRAGEFAEASGDAAGAVAHYDVLARGTTATPDDLLMRLGRARLAAGDRDGAVEAFTRLHEVYPLSDLAPAAAAQLTDLDAWAPLEKGSARYGKELKRAERLFAARRYAQARDAFEALLPVSGADDHELVSLRLAECDHYLKRYDAARAAPVAVARSRVAARRGPVLPPHRHARAGRACRVRAAGRGAGRGVPRRLVVRRNAEQPGDALHPGRRRRERRRRRSVELARQFPAGRHAPRAAWKVGWNAYRQGRHAECAEIFEAAASAFPRSDYPAAVDLLGRPLARPAGRCPHRQPPLRHHRRRLPELVLRPHRRARADRRARWSR